VNPCWDESYSPSAFTAMEAPAITRALEETCPRWQSRSVQSRRARYRAVGCHSRTHELTAALVAKGELPNPAEWSIDRVCSARGQRALAPLR
jgi:hypothetical protein